MAIKKDPRFLFSEDRDVITEHTATEVLLSYLRNNFCCSHDADINMRVFEDEMKRNKLSFYPTFPAIQEKLAVIMVDPKYLTSPRQLCLDLHKEDLDQLGKADQKAMSPVWHMHSGFQAIAEQAHYLRNMGVRSVMFLTFDAYLYTRYIFGAFVEDGSFLFQIEPYGKVHSEWSKIVERGEMHIILNKNRHLSGLFLK